MPNSSPCIMSRYGAIHPNYHSATKMKKTTNLAKMSSQFLDKVWDLADMFLKTFFLFVYIAQSSDGASNTR